MEDFRRGFAGRKRHIKHAAPSQVRGSQMPREILSAPSTAPIMSRVFAEADVLERGTNGNQVPTDVAHLEAVSPEASQCGNGSESKDLGSTKIESPDPENELNPGQQFF